MKLRAPSGDGEQLIVPDRQELPRLVEQNRRASHSPDDSPFGRPWSELIRAARHETLERAIGYTASYHSLPKVDINAVVDAPLIVGGHQPQLFHPGVWLKNFELSRLAERVGGTALNLIVDSDTLRT